MKKFLVVLLIIIESISLFLLYKSSINKKEEPEKLDDVIYKEQKTDFIYLLEQNYGQEDYLESQINSWPNDSYIFNEIKSYCLDYDNINIEDALLYNNDNNTLVLDTNVAKVCYLYFSKK